MGSGGVDVDVSFPPLAPHGTGNSKGKLSAGAQTNKTSPLAVEGQPADQIWKMSVVEVITVVCTNTVVGSAFLLA